MKDFTLNGAIEESNGKWCAEIVLTTPDGKQSRLNSGYEFNSKDEAADNLRFNMDRILAEFSKNGVEVIARDGVKYS